MADPLLLGAHFSIAGGFENALYQARDHCCTVAQIFTKNARSWKEPELTREQIQRFEAARFETGVSRVFSHCTYLINIAGNDGLKLEKSRRSLQAEMIRSARLGLDGVVLHPGAHLGQGPEKGLEIARKSIAQVLAADDGSFPDLLIETTAGSGTCLGGRFSEIYALVCGFQRGVGVCLDTSHIFAAGYDIRTFDALERTVAAFDRTLGLSRLKLIHLNDSEPGLGSQKDRHAHIGRGMIGITGFKAVMASPLLKHVPKIIETPKSAGGVSMDAVNLGLLRELAN